MSHAQKEIWEIREKQTTIEIDTLYDRKGEIRQIMETEQTYWDYVPITLSDTIQSTERLNKYGGFVKVEEVSLKEVVQKYSEQLPTEREVYAFTESQYMINDFMDLGVVIFITDVELENQIWIRKESRVETILTVYSIQEDTYQKYIQPRDGYTRIIEKKRQGYPCCMITKTHEEYGILPYGMTGLEQKISGWIFLTSPKEVY